MRELCEKRVLGLVTETQMQLGILGFVKRNYYDEMSDQSWSDSHHFWPKDYWTKWATH